ncbi:unnamed protein product [Parnassius apollo]|uniref:(apollo) hypothetical protein n=1 Tax=Parnassius apollo TaxID=110799 RepID=A0A8S3XLD6_PARAO|nr:unnamed protein product [Parnassius apollo]
MQWYLPVLASYPTMYDSKIVVPEAFILGSGEHHDDLGSVIHLICILEKATRWRRSCVTCLLLLSSVMVHFGLR